MPDVSSAVKPLEGKTTIDDKMFFEPERLSYESAVEAAARIAHRIKAQVSVATVVIAGTRLLADFSNLVASYLTLDNLRRDYESLATLAQTVAKRREISATPLEGVRIAAVLPAVSSMITPVTATVGAALGLVSLFRQDVEYHGEKTTVDELAFELALAAQVKEMGAARVFVPDLMVLSPPQDKNNSLQGHLEKAQEAKARAWAGAAPLISELVRLESELDKAATSKDQKALDRLSGEVSDMRRDLAPISDPLSRLDQRFADLQNQWNQADPASGLVQLGRLLRAEALRALNPIYLHAAVVSSGGFYRITRNLFRMLFMGDGLSFAGGTAVRWSLLDQAGAVNDGGIVVVGLTGRFARRNRRLVTHSPTGRSVSGQHVPPADAEGKVSLKHEDKPEELEQGPN